MTSQKNGNLPKVFICYSSKDTDIKGSIINHLKVFERSKKIQIWYDRLIDPGKRWRKTITKELETCDVAVLLISNDFLITEFIIDIEFNKFLERERSKDVYIFPILIDYCNWQENQDLREFQVLPNRSEPIISFPIENGARNKILSETASQIANIAYEFYKSREKNASKSKQRQKQIKKNYKTKSDKKSIIYKNKLVGELQVYQYSSDQFRQLLLKNSLANESYLNGLPSINYYEEYFGTQNTKTIVVEPRYNDSNYMNEYSSVYSKSYVPFEKTCTRLHFFGSKFGVKELSDLLEGTTSPIHKELLQGSYIGYITVKPVPKGIIGVSNLMIPTGSGRRSISLRSTSHTNLFGCPLHINSVPFQEQDIKATCAMNALWSLLQITSNLYHHSTPSGQDLIDIVNDTRLMSPFSKLGLSENDIVKILKEFSIEPDLIQIFDLNLFKSAICAYLSCNIPIILTLKVYDFSSGEGVFIGKHAVTITGVDFGLDTTVDVTETGIFLKSSNVDKLYVHDDQVGPYSRLIFEDQERKLTSEVNKYSFIKPLAIEWYSASNKEPGFIKCYPSSMIVPLHKDIDLSFNKIFADIIVLNSLIETLNIQDILKIDSVIEWEITLASNNQIKHELFLSSLPRGKYKREILLMPLPKFLWRVSGEVKGEKLIELLFDASDFGFQTTLLMPIVYNNTLLAYFLALRKKIEEIPLDIGLKEFLLALSRLEV